MEIGKIVIYVKGVSESLSNLVVCPYVKYYDRRR